MGDFLGVLLTVLLLAVNAFFVASEFALISARRDRLEALAEQGKKSAVTVIRAGEHLSLMLAGAQLGITICSILLGRVGEPAVAFATQHGDSRRASESAGQGTLWAAPGTAPGREREPLAHDGERGRDVLVCVHGLTRTGRDFDEVARALCGQFRVVCPDVAGRGDSDPLPDAMLYGVPQYAADMITLIARLDVETVSWLGTSMGGLIGMALAAQAGSPVKRLALNDVGPLVTKASLERLASYVGKAPTFASVEEAERYLRTISAPFGPHSDAQWRFLTETWLRRNDDGSWRAHYDPRLAEPFKADKDLELWPLYDAVRCPTLVLRGELSDLLTQETAAEMTRRGPRAKVVEIRGVGHAPTLLHPEQIALVRDFFLGGIAS